MCLTQHVNHHGGTCSLGGSVLPGGQSRVPMHLAWPRCHTYGSMAGSPHIGQRLSMQGKIAAPVAHWLKTALICFVFNHTFASCQKLGQWCFVFELVSGAVPTAIRYNLKHIMVEHATKCHIGGCSRSMWPGSICPWGPIMGAFPLLSPNPEKKPQILTLMMTSQMHHSIAD